MPTTELIDINLIDLQKRVRYAETPEAKEDLERLADSIRRFGVLQPLLIGPGNVLIAGWRRYTASQLAGLLTVPVHRRESLTESEYQEIELEENVQRRDFTWQEQIEATCRIHDTRKREATLKGKEWTRQMTGELIDYSDAYVDNCFRLRPFIAPPLDKDKDLEVCAAEGITDALRIVLRRDQDKAMAEKAKRSSLQTGVVLPNVQDLLAGLVTPTAEPITTDVEQIIDLSHSLFQGDSARDLLPQWPPECVDHCITDMPYAIDMGNLDQSETSLLDTLRVADTHDVQENLTLYQVMFPAVYRVLKDGGFFITWCDIMNWNLLYELATRTGFKVQRWPITWHKTSICKNQMAHVNFTKTTEIAIVCRKGRATLPTPVSTCVVSSPNDELKVSNPFAKPYSVWEFIIESVTIQGQTILDPCAGQGSGTVAALKLNRKALAIERDEVHWPYLVDNVKNHWKTVFKQVKFV